MQACIKDPYNSMMKGRVCGEMVPLCRGLSLCSQILICVGFGHSYARLIKCPNITKHCVLFMHLFLRRGKRSLECLLSISLSAIASCVLVNRRPGSKIGTKQARPPLQFMMYCVPDLSYIDSGPVLVHKLEWNDNKQSAIFFRAAHPNSHPL